MDKIRLNLYNHTDLQTSYRFTKDVEIERSLIRHYFNLVKIRIGEATIQVKSEKSLSHSVVRIKFYIQDSIIPPILSFHKDGWSVEKKICNKWTKQNPPE